MKSFVFTIDTEQDLHTGKYGGIKKGIPRLLKILDKYNIKATFFTTCDCIEKYPKIFKNLKKKGHEIALHGYRHERYDDLLSGEKEANLRLSINCFKKHLKTTPKGFRAPQHSLDNETLDLLEKYKFKYDSSLTPLNLLQLFFFPKRFELWFRSFFTPSKKYKIRKNLWEIPPTSLLIPFVSLSIRLFPKWKLKIHYFLLSLLTKDVVFYIHSWDLIEMPKSRIYRLCPLSKFLNKLDYLLNKISKKKNTQFKTMGQIAK